MLGRSGRKKDSWNRVDLQTKKSIENIKKRLIAAWDRQRIYANLGRKDTTFEVGDKVLLKVSPKKGVIRFCKNGKLSPRFIGSFEIYKKVIYSRFLSYLCSKGL